jgi:polar amino acid transport system permease protein
MGSEAAEPVRAGEVRAIPVRHPGRWVGAVVVLYLAVAVGGSMATNKRFQWSVVGHYLGRSQILHGLVVTLELTAASMVIGIVLGVALAVMRLSPNPLVSSASWLYIWFFRGTPVFVQILFWFNIPALYPNFSVGIPFGPQFAHVNLTSLITPFVAGMLALGLNEGAYMSEIVRAGIISVDEGQTEAAQSLGMTRLLTMRRIVLPQAMRVIVPPTGNETIGMLKTSSLVSAIAVTELLYSAQIIYARTYQTIQLLIVASIWYLIVTTVLSVGQYYLERYFGRGVSRQARPSMLALWWRNVSSLRPGKRAAR